MSGEGPVTDVRGVPYLPIEETRRVMALELAVRSRPEWASGEAMTALIVERAAEFETFIEGETS